MANRVFDELRKWIALDDAALATAMRNLGIRETGETQLARARRLFALALETPGGLKVQTIHAFCTSLLHLFPFEADVAAHFEVLDETAEIQLLDELTIAVLLEAAARPEGMLGRALAVAIASSADVTFREMVREAIRQRDRVSSWIEAAGTIEAAIAELSRSLGIEPADNEADVNADFFRQSLIHSSEWPAVAAALAQGGDRDAAQGSRFASLAKLRAAEWIESYIDIFCTKELAPRKNIVTAAIRDGHPELFERLMGEQRRVCELIARRHAVRTRDRTGALLTIADAVIRRYRAEKNRRGLLDYEDLIDKTLDLLRGDRPKWVHYKLDRGIDHVLIDEAQDTSPKQWAIVRALTAEFFAGEGAHPRRRTVFAVGDEKQSIFSFQGAAPREFADMRAEFDRLHRRAELTFVATEFKYSFRSGHGVLQAVDTVFSRPQAYDGLTADATPPVHESLPDAAPGLVEIWDTERAAERDDIEGWDAPFDEVSENSPHARLARRIAQHIKLWRCRPKDVLILVRRRGAQFEAIIRALKDAGIPVAGSDRLVLTEHIAVMDLMALADAVLLPDDDLALATVLKSPLFGLDDDALFELAWDRKGSLVAAMRSSRPDLAAEFDAIREAARRNGPFAFYAWLLGCNGGRRKIQQRLGHDAADALDEFLNRALDYERTDIPSLQGFVHWLRATAAEIKRDMEMERDEVRVMTVHGAKGLEARTVFLADTTTPPQGWHPPRILALPVAGAPDRLVWAGPKANDVGPMAKARQAALIAAANEYRRVLYVAMTRPSERLIVCGTDGKKAKRPDGCWYDLVRGALEGACVKEPADDGEGEVLRYRKTAPAPTAAEAAAPPPAPEPHPPWLFRPVESETARIASIRPSGDKDETINVRSAIERRHALLRGQIMHRLLQSLPSIPPPQQAEAARRHAARQGFELPENVREEIVSRTLALLNDPRLGSLFAPGSRSEVPIIGRIGGQDVAGIVDRLVIGPDAVLIADFKTDRPSPRGLADVLARYPGYIRQLALYRAVLMRLYPSRPVRAALVWTDLPQSMEIPVDVMDEAVATITAT